MMGSWIECLCGTRLHTNLFTGTNVYRLINDSDYDTIEDLVDRDKLSDLFFNKGIPVYCCARCGRLVVEWPEQGGPSFYLPEGKHAEGRRRKTTTIRND